MYHPHLLAHGPLPSTCSSSVLTLSIFLLEDQVESWRGIQHAARDPTRYLGVEELPTLWQRTGLDCRQLSHGSEVTTLNQRRTVDERFLRIESEGWFVVATTQRALINGEPNDVDGAVNVRPPFHQ